MTDCLSAAKPTPGVAPCQPLLPAGGAPCRAMLSYIHRSRRQNVGSLAESEGHERASKARKCPCAGDKLEAAIGVEPMMDVLQSSVGRAHG